MIDENIIAVFGGCFNPPLNSHFSLADQIVNEYEFIEKIIFIPVNSKYNKEELLSNSHRYNMLKIVCNKNPKFEVSDIEITNDRPLYTIETLNEIQKSYPKNIIWFIIGTDNLKILENWEKAKELVSNFKILVLERDNDDFSKIINNSKFLNKNKNAFIKVKNNIKSNISSTFVREKIKKNKSIRYLVPEEIYVYIERNKLFKEGK